MTSCNTTDKLLKMGIVVSGKKMPICTLYNEDMKQRYYCKDSIGLDFLKTEHREGRERFIFAPLSRRA